ncbi:MAG: SseB family protein [Glaciihabitans sp.]|nr:SseB family protein [Glaciihabitans sp.]
MAGADSAGVPWEGRSFDHVPASEDDGSAPERLVEALRRFRSRELGEAEVVAALRESRLLIPLVAHLGEAGENEHGVLVDKTQELSIVTVVGPDGRTVLPVFTSVAAMSAWNPKARPIPADAVRVAFSASSEGTDVVVLDPTSATEFAVRRPALWAIARGESWLPSYMDEDVLAEFVQSAEPEPTVLAVRLAPGDPDARLAGAELLVHLTLADGLAQSDLDDLLGRLQQRWAESPVIAQRVDSLRVQLAGIG